MIGLLSTGILFGQGFVPTFSQPGGLLPSLGMGAAQPILVDPKRIQMSQSVTFSALSGGGSTISQSLYQNRMALRLADSLTFHLNLGIMTPLSASGPMAQGFQRGAYLIPSLGLEYAPTESFKMMLLYTALPSAPMGSKGGLPWQ